MNRFLAWADDRLNPIVVKELRQAVQGRFVAAVLHLLLIMQVMIITTYLLSGEIETVNLTSSRGKGNEIFSWIFGFLLFATIVVLPLFVAVRLSLERMGDALSLLFISTLPPRRIISGIFLANLGLILLLFSACLPFVFFTYFLRGIDLPSILVILVGGFVIASVCLQGAILAACLPTTRFIRILLGLAVLGGLPICFTFALQFLMFQLSSGIGSRLGTIEFWNVAGLLLGISAFLLGVAYLLAVAVVSPPTANRAPPPRLFLSVSWLISGLVMTYQSHLGHSYLATMWLMTWTVIALGGLAVAISAPDQMSARVARSVPPSVPRRLVTFFFYSGSANGLAWSTLLLLLTMLTIRELNDWLPGKSPIDGREEMAGFAGYCVAYALTALFVQRQFLARRWPVGRTWFVALCLMLIGALLPMVVGFLLSPEDFARDTDNWRWLMLNPFSPFENSTKDFTIPFGLCWAGLSLVLACRWGWRQARAFTPAGRRSGLE